MILSEDSYGKGFFKELTNRLKNEQIISKFHVSVNRFYGPCNIKLEKQLKVYFELREFSNIIIFVDADGKSIEEIKRRIEIHIERCYEGSVKIIILKYEIEDWLCISENIKIRCNKPSKILKETKKYKKCRLKQYVPKLNFKKLCEECETFNDFLSILQCFS